MLRADRAAEFLDKVVNLVSQRPQFRGILALRQVEERPHVNLSGRGVNEVRRRRLVPLQHFLHPVQISRQNLHGHADVFDESQGATLPRWAYRLGKAASRTSRTRDLRCVGGNRRNQSWGSAPATLVGRIEGQRAVRRPASRPHTPQTKLPRSWQAGAPATSALPRARVSKRRSMRSQATGAFAIAAPPRKAVSRLPKAQQKQRPSTRQRHRP